MKKCNLQSMEKIDGVFVTLIMCVTSFRLLFFFIIFAESIAYFSEVSLIVLTYLLIIPVFSII